MREATKDVFGPLDNKAWMWFFKMRIRLYNQRKKPPAGDLAEQLFARYTAEEVSRQHKVYLEAQQRVRQERIVGLQRQGTPNVPPHPKWILTYLRRLAKPDENGRS